MKKEKITRMITANKSNSLRTTIPIFLTKQYNLAPGDCIKWVYEEDKIEIKFLRNTVSDIIPEKKKPIK